SRKTQKRQEDGKGSYSYRRQVFGQEFDLPEAANPKTVTCAFSKGRFRIWAPSEALPEVTERVLPINMSPAVSNTQESGSCTQSGTQRN
ncbi:heat shock protein beta-11-like, partial [Arapaima gigas]